MVNSPRDGLTHLVIANMSGLTQRIEEGTVIGEAQTAEVLISKPVSGDIPLAHIRRLSSSRDEERRKRLLKMLQLTDVPESDAKQLHAFLADNYDVFSLVKGERGETALVKMEIDTGDEQPRKQPPRRMPFMVREEVTRQLKKMQQDGMIQPSASPWSSPVVMVRKKRRFSPLLRGLQGIELCH